MKRKTDASAVPGTVVWFARTKHIIRIGPFATQVEASAATLVTRHDPQCRSGHWPFTGPCHPDCLEVPAEGAFVWPEKRVNKWRTQR